MEMEESMWGGGRGEVGMGRTGRTGGKEGGVTVNNKKKMCLLNFQQEKTHCFVTGKNKVCSLKQEYV